MTPMLEQPARTRSQRRRACAAATGLALSATLLVPTVAAAGQSSRPAPDPAVQRTLDDLVRKDGFPGVLAAVRTSDGRVRDYRAGVANLATQQRLPLDGQVRIGSNTKTFVATVVLQLVAEGEVQLDASVETYLPGLLRGKGIDGRRITVRQLLQHTSGLPEYVDLWFKDFARNQNRFVEPHELLETALTRPAQFAPGKKWAYSNTNYIVAGLLVQRVTGRPVAEEVNRRIIKPLGLRGTYWPREGERTLRGRHPRGYHTLVPGKAPVDVTATDTSAPWAAGALVSTPRDLMTFFTALLDGDLLEPAQLEEMQTTVAAPGSTIRGDERYGLGIQTFTLSCGGTAWTHGGDIPGFETRHAVTTDGRAAVVAVTSLPHGMPAARHVERAVDRAIC